MATWEDKLIPWYHEYMDKLKPLKPASIYEDIDRADLTITVNDQMRSTAGRYKWRGKDGTPHLLIMNGNLTEEQAKRTFGHELAHFIDHVVFFKHGHGDTWKRAMRWIGLDPRRCHDYKQISERAKRHTVKRFLYRCVICDLKMHAKRKPAEIGHAYCRRCKSKNIELYRAYLWDRKTGEEIDIPIRT